jgi:hypothetical protein
MKTLTRFTGLFAIAVLVALTLNVLVPPAEAAPKYKANITGPADGGPSTPTCFAGQQKVITFETGRSLGGVTTIPPSFCFKTCQANGGTTTAPTATLASCAADCTKDYVPLLQPLGFNALDAGAKEPVRYTTVPFAMANDNCISVAPVDATLPLDGGVVLFEVTQNNLSPANASTY